MSSAIDNASPLQAFFQQMDGKDGKSQLEKDLEGPPGPGKDAAIRGLAENGNAKKLSFEELSSLAFDPDASEESKQAAADELMRRHGSDSDI